MRMSDWSSDVCSSDLTFFREEYVPNARDTLAAEAMPGGEAWYRQQIREYTTLDLDPDEIHAIGLREVDRIQRETDADIREVGCDGDIAGFRPLDRVGDV